MMVQVCEIAEHDSNYCCLQEHMLMEIARVFVEDSTVNFEFACSHAYSPLIDVAQSLQSIAIDDSWVTEPERSLN